MTEHGRIQDRKPDDQSHAGTGSHGGVAAPEVISRIEHRQKIKHQGHALRSNQEVDHGRDQHQKQQQKQLFGYLLQAPSYDARRG